LVSVVKLTGSTSCWPVLLVLAGHGLFGGLLPTLLLPDVSRGSGQAGLLLIHRPVAELALK
jgi:hypothetical protein